ncbi:MAG: hypothetical protein ACLQPD_20860, partial [Desulfomonilaceae bacterium]
FQGPQNSPPEKQDLPQIVGRSRLIPINVIVKLKQYVIRTFSTNFSSKIRSMSSVSQWRLV